MCTTAVINNNPTFRHHCLLFIVKRSNSDNMQPGMLTFTTTHTSPYSGLQGGKWGSQVLMVESCPPLDLNLQASHPRCMPVTTRPRAWDLFNKSHYSYFPNEILMKTQNTQLQKYLWSFVKCTFTTFHDYKLLSNFCSFSLFFLFFTATLSLCCLSENKPGRQMK